VDEPLQGIVSTVTYDLSFVSHYEIL